MDSIEPLAPDACRSDHCAPCYYLHLKRRALNGERDKLTQRELDFVGVGVSRRRDRSGWHQPDGLYFDDPLDSFGLSAEDSAVLHSLMDIEFLG
jgi:hypothetical protein